jgi:glycosyltransferase involved in cell wall biosynthesis
MRSLLVSHRFPPDGLGGVERYTQALAADLVEAGDSVSIMTRRTQHGRKDFDILRERLPDGTPLFRIVAGDLRFDHFLESHERLDQMFTRATIEASPDVVHINHLMGLSPRFIQIAHRLGAAVVVSLHDFYFVCPRVHLQKPTGDLCAGPDHGQECVRTCFTVKPQDGAVLWGLRSLYFRQALAMAERVICYSDYVASYFRNVLGAKRVIQMIPNGISVDSGDRTLGRRQNTALRVAFFGTVAVHKGPHVVLEALRAAKLKSATFLVIGHAPDRDYVARLRREAAAIPGLTFKMYGQYERRELPFLLQDIDCVIVPSLVPEAGPIVPREALAHGVPVLAARLGALPELIREGDNGFTFDSLRPGELAGILIRLAASEELRQRLRAGARRSPVITVLEHTQRVRAVYEQAIADFRNNPRNLADTPDFTFLHKSLLDLGCDPSRRRPDNSATNATTVSRR